MLGLVSIISALLTLSAALLVRFKKKSAFLFGLLGAIIMVAMGLISGPPGITILGLGLIGINTEALISKEWKDEKWF